MDIGLCFDDESAEEVSSVPEVDCAEPHDNEVFAKYDVADGSFPGDQALLDTAMETCTAEYFATYVGTAYADSDLEVFPITPTAASWDDGDREIVCALYALDLSKLTGSMEGSQR